MVFRREGRSEGKKSKRGKGESYDRYIKIPSGCIADERRSTSLHFMFPCLTQPLNINRHATSMVERAVPRKFDHRT